MTEKKLDLTEYEPDILEDEEDIYNLKMAINKLTPVEKKIWLTYVDIGTYAGVAKQFKVSAPTAKTYLNNIREKILDNYDN